MSQLEEQNAVKAIRSAAGQVLRSVWHHGGLAALARQLAGRRGAILRYHSVTDDQAKTLAYLDSGLMVSDTAFRAQLAYLRRFYTTLPLDEMVDRVHRNRPLPRNAVAITFDDGYRDNYTLAYPLLRAEGIPATFFVTTGCLDGGPPLWTAKLRFMVQRTTRERIPLPRPLGPSFEIRSSGDRQDLFTRSIIALKNVPSERRRDLMQELAEVFGVTDFTPLSDIMMTWDQLREMSNNGMTIGAHTISHPNLPNTATKEATDEIIGSRDMIAGRIGAPVAHFSYPNGRGSAHLNEMVRGIVRRSGFLSAVTSVSGCVRGDADPWALRRVGVYNRHRHLPSFSLDVERARSHNQR
jgi:peptidoglycan/xylan/chitin deacetylase (PgdA/CDA1 family)